MCVQNFQLLTEHHNEAVTCFLDELNVKNTKNSQNTNRASSFGFFGVGLAVNAAGLWGPLASS